MRYVHKLLTFMLMFGTVMVLWVLALPTEAQTTNKGLASPLNPNLSSVPTFIEAFLKAIIQVALPIIAVFIVVSGFMFVWARGNPERLKTAKRNFVYVIAGAILMLSGWVIATLVLGTISQLLR